MLLSLNWLRELTPYDGTNEALGDKLTMLGLELEEVLHPFAHLEQIVVGHVLTREQHPEADKLSVCTVDVGPAGDGEPLTIVCGAPNVAAGQKVPVALVGAALPGGLTIKKAKLRGVPSAGMICSERELELSDEHEGIMVLEENATVGARLTEVLPLDEVVFDLGITPNRADCLSHLGVAREVAMAFGLPLTLPPFGCDEADLEPAENLMRIEISDPELCPLYAGRIIEGVAVKPSPAWLRYRLKAVGVRPISNLVDITNYILFELGQPLHAFDLDTLTGGVIRVAPATDGMKLTTLDDQERTLTKDDLCIWDGAKAVALAGVMGGAETEIGPDSTRVLLEAAVFRPASIRRTARRLALPSEASYRFERGVDQLGCHHARERAAQLMADLGGGQIRPGLAIAEPSPWKHRHVGFRPQRASQLIGVPMHPDFCRDTILGMGCSFKEEICLDAQGCWQLTIPSHRLDLEREVDVIEELARVHGMDQVPATVPTITPAMDPQPEGEGPTGHEFAFFARLRAWGVAAGLNEAVNYSFVGNRDLDRLNLPAENRVPVANPLSEEQDVLRTVLAPGLLHDLRVNMAHGVESVRLFEIAHIFLADKDSETTAREYARLGVLLCGLQYDEAWPHPPRLSNNLDYADLMGAVDHILGHFKLARLNAGTPRYAIVDGHPYLSPCVELTLGEQKLGTLGRVKPEIADHYNARADVWLAELDAELLRILATAEELTFSTLPVYPPVKRDMTVIAEASLSCRAVEDAILASGSNNLESVHLLDVYEPEDGQAAAERNLTYRMTFRAEKTLKDKEVDKEMKKVADSLLKALPVRLSQ